MNLTTLNKATALVLWADEKIDPEEMEGAKDLYEKYDFSWSECKLSLEQEIENLVYEDENGDEEEGSEEELYLGVLDFGEGIDTMDILVDLAGLACADQRVTFSEVDLIHRLGEAMNAQAELVSAALLLAVSQSSTSVEIE